MSVVNDMYAKDISKKVRTAKKTKAEKGEFIGAFAPYGYKKHPNDITKLIIDDEVVDVVKYIFSEYNNGGGLAYIARRLNEKILNAHRYISNVHASSIVKHLQDYGDMQLLERY